MIKERCTAIVVAAGQGSRMNTKIQKQYLLLHNKPVLYFCLKVFQNSNVIDEVILVTGSEEIAYCQESIVDRYDLTKVLKIVPGGSTRDQSVYKGILAIDQSDYVFIHDGARPFVDETMLQNAFTCVREYDACVIGMPVKDTIKIADEQGIITQTPNRNQTWLVQTPQVFSYNLIKNAYDKLSNCKGVAVTDDAMVVEQMEHIPIKLIEGSYENIKITTPEDMKIAEIFCKERKE